MGHGYYLPSVFAVERRCEPCPGHWQFLEDGWQAHPSMIGLQPSLGRLKSG